jgi:hypothetical protein
MKCLFSTTKLRTSSKLEAFYTFNNIGISILLFTTYEKQKNFSIQWSKREKKTTKHTEYAERS